MRTVIATLAVATLIATFAGSVAWAAPTQVNVRIEGRGETLFEGPIWTEGHDIEASSDTQERSCDGIDPNDPENVTPGPTPTAAAVDAMSLIGETFDGRWYGGYGDYFITRWGPDREAEGMSWGILVNNVFTDVGGCQYELHTGDEALWAYDAFQHKPFLALLAADEHYTSGTRPLTATAELDKPFHVEVLDYDDDTEDVPPIAPERTESSPYEDADVSPVQTSAEGFELVQTASPATVKTNAEGKASITFTEPGWHRIKATAVNGEGEESAIRSNRLDVCVPAQDSTSCPHSFPEDQVRTPPRYAEGVKEEHHEETTATGPGSNPGGGRRARLDSTVRYLQDVQNLDGGFGGEPGGESNPDFSAWVALALAAAGINPRDQSRPGGTDVYTYLVEHAGELTKPNAECARSSCTTELERALLVVDASGTSPEDFGGVHLVQQLLARQLTGTHEAGAFVHEAGARTPGVNDTIFAILALSPVREPAVQSALEHAASWLIGEQNPENGGWSAVCPRTVADCSEAAEVDMTGAAIQALNAAGIHGSASQQKAIAFLHEAQDPDGGFPEFPGHGEESNVASTAWAVQAIWAAGENPETWVKGSGHEPLDYMESLQHADGSIQWKASSDSNPVWMTAYAAPAFAGDPWPIPAPPYVEHPPSGPTGDRAGATPPSPGSAEPGQGGESSQPGSGVIAGGGGDGAPLFSRPQPQSKGRTPGGVRSLGTTHEQSTPNRRDPRRRRKATFPTTQHRRNSDPRRNAPGRTGSGGEGAGKPEVKGVLIGAPTAGQDKDVLEPGAPGLHSAGAGGNHTPWLAIGIGSAIALLALLGSQLERRRPQAVL